MKKIIAVLFFFFSAGCSVVHHKEQLLTLKGYGEEQEKMAEYVKMRDAQFDDLLRVVKNNQIQGVKTKQEFIARFGVPIFEKEIVRNGTVVSMLLYRHQMQRFDAEKVYLYFDKDGNLVDWVHDIPVKKEGADEQAEEGASKT